MDNGFTEKQHYTIMQSECNAACLPENNKIRISNFCTFEIASLINVPGHYLRKYGI